ncbi:MAG: hypothetical protein COB22_02135 [Cycloclasticus sp.]|nr:MAG: hypothetical protein COB22_02135 [Cycloclasticus sp.]
MSEFNNVTVVKKANVYFDGKVVSRTVKFEDGSSKTLGLMMPGDYNFDTQAAEIMEILAGRLDVLLPDNSDWQTIVGGESFNVPANSNFQLKIHQATDYCCSFIEE